ncbi:MAG: divalent cation tolerance protein CutA [Sphaerochaeta sp.]
MYQLIFYVPSSHLESVKEAIFKEGAGSLQGYDHCCWQTLGTGQFRAGDSCNPFLGKIGEIHEEKEWKVECIVADNKIKKVIEALIESHPYEVPGYSVMKSVNI